MIEGGGKAGGAGGLVAIVMASGFSRRMGTNKLLLPLDGLTVIERVLRVIGSVGYSGVIVVSQYAEILALAQRLGFFAVLNAQAARGKSSSIRLGLGAAAELTAAGRLPESAAATFFTGDQIFLSRDFLTRLKEEWSARTEALVFPAYGGKAGSPGIFPADCFDELLALEGEAGGMAVAKRHADRLRLVPAESDIEGFDFDTQEEWRQALRLWSSRQGE